MLIRRRVEVRVKVRGFTKVKDLFPKDCLRFVICYFDPMQIRQVYKL